MGRIVAPVVITNTIKSEYRITCDALVDTGASSMVLPSAWKKKLGDIETVGQIEVELANQTALSGNNIDTLADKLRAKEKNEKVPVVNFTCKNELTLIKA